MPENHPLVGNPDELGDVAVCAVERWAEAVAANRASVEHVERVRDPDRSARRTRRDLADRLATKREAYELGPADEPVRAEVEAATSDDDTDIALDELDERTAAHTESDVPATARDDYALADLVYALRSLGFRDAGTPGTPVFERPAG